MAKPRLYGILSPDPKRNGYTDQSWKRKQQRKRQRESTTPKPVAAQIVKEKEADNAV